MLSFERTLEKNNKQPSFVGVEFFHNNPKQYMTVIIFLLRSFIYLFFLSNTAVHYIYILYFSLTYVHIYYYI